MEQHRARVGGDVLAQPAPRWLGVGVGAGEGLGLGSGVGVGVGLGLILARTLALTRGVEVVGRLVEDEDLWLGEEQPRLGPGAGLGSGLGSGLVLRLGSGLG